MRRSHLRSIPLAGFALAYACAQPPPWYVCRSNDQCGERNRCVLVSAGAVPPSLCAERAPYAECASGWKYQPSSGPWSGQCVARSADMSVADGGASPERPRDDAALADGLRRDSARSDLRLADAPPADTAAGCPSACGCSYDDTACGTPAIDCTKSGTICVGTICEAPPPPTTLAGGLNAPVEVTVDSTSVYFTEAMANAVMKVPITGGSAAVLATDTSSPHGIAVDANNVYWTDTLSTGGMIKQMPLSGGTVVVLATGQNNPYWIAVDSSFVYWTNAETSAGGGAVLRVRIGGGLAQPLVSCSAASDYPIDIAVDATNLYWDTLYGPGGLSSTSGTIWEMPKGGGVLPTPLAAGQDYPDEIAIDSRYVYWTNFSNACVKSTSSTGSILRVPIAGGSVQVLASSQPCPVGLAIDRTSAYWTNPNLGTVMKAPLPGCGTYAPVTLFSSAAPSEYLAVDATQLYWDVIAAAPGGAIMAMSK